MHKYRTLWAHSLHRSVSFFSPFLIVLYYSISSKLIKQTLSLWFRSHDLSKFLIMNKNLQRENMNIVWICRVFYSLSSRDISSSVIYVLKDLLLSHTLNKLQHLLFTCSTIIGCENHEQYLYDGNTYLVWWYRNVHNWQ